MDKLIDIVDVYEHDEFNEPITRISYSSVLRDTWRPQRYDRSKGIWESWTYISGGVIETKSEWYYDTLSEAIGHLEYHRYNSYLVRKQIAYDYYPDDEGEDDVIRKHSNKTKDFFECHHWSSDEREDKIAIVTKTKSGNLKIHKLKEVTIEVEVYKWRLFKKPKKVKKEKEVKKFITNSDEFSSLNEVRDFLLEKGYDNIYLYRKIIKNKALINLDK